MKFKRYEKKLENVLSNVILIISVMGLIASTAIFFNGVHNIDLQQNVINIQNQYLRTVVEENYNGTLILPDLNIEDTGADYVTRPLVDYYIAGMNDIRTALYISMICAFLMGLVINLRRDNANSKKT